MQSDQPAHKIYSAFKYLLYERDIEACRKSAVPVFVTSYFPVVVTEMITWSNCQNKILHLTLQSYYDTGVNYFSYFLNF